MNIKLLLAVEIFACLNLTVNRSGLNFVLVQDFDSGDTTLLRRQQISKEESDATVTDKI
jgi:hypothetical protein